MENISNSQRTLFVISIWAEVTHGKPPVWRGSIRTIDGQRKDFNSFAGLNRLMGELSGWQDPPEDTNEALQFE
jgi:hypothetical protein